MFAQGETRNCRPERAGILGTPCVGEPQGWGVTGDILSQVLKLDLSPQHILVHAQPSNATSSMAGDGAVSSQSLKSEISTWEETVWEKTTFKLLLKTC